ncbi:MAG: CHAP domain-containing protein [Candidatus Methanomethylicaceae archaeon]
MLIIASIAHLDTAYRYTTVRELQPNRSPEIDAWNRFVGAPLGANYCASFVSYCLAKAQSRWPKVRTAVALHFAKYGLPPTGNVPAGAILVWRRGMGWQGHVGFAVLKRGDLLYTIEANTSPRGGLGYEQWNGNGVWLKQRSWRTNVFAGNAFRIVSVVKVLY